MNRAQPQKDRMSRRTKRRYAHELYPHPRYDEEDEPRPLAVEVPYLYAHALGMDVTGTGWLEIPDGRLRIQVLVHARHVALLADALLQGLSGQEAWDWVHEHRDESGELIWDRAVHYGVDPSMIKPYACGPEPEDHYHQLPGAPAGHLSGVPGRESDCEQCTEEGAEDE